jgi:Tfp pilus assembly protein FimT
MHGSCVPIHRRVLKRTSSQRRGFSAVEFILVLATFAIVAAMAVPRFSAATERAAIEAGAQRLAAEFDVIRQRARLTGLPATMSFVLGSGSVHVSGIPTDGLWLDGPNLDLGAPPYGIEVRKVTLNVSGSITFDARGYPDVTGSVVIGRGGHERTITIDGGGKASVQ